LTFDLCCAVLVMSDKLWAVLIYVLSLKPDCETAVKTDIQQ